MCFYLDDNLIGSSTSHTITVNMATRDITTKQNAGWRAKLEGMREWSGTGEGFVAFDDTYGFPQLYAFITNRTPVTLKFSTEVSGDSYFSGECYLTSLQVDAPQEENTSYSVSFEGASALSVSTGT
jgi:TP901-1 family phage major tail protein